MGVEGILHLGTLTGYTIPQSKPGIKCQVQFPQNQIQMSTPIKIDESHFTGNIDLGYDSTYILDTSNPMMIDSLIADPIKITLLALTADLSNHHAMAEFEFTLYLDALLEQRKTILEADLIGKHIEGGEFDPSISAPTLHISFSVPEPLLPEEISNGSAILRLKVEGMTDLPKAIIESSLHKDDKVHTFDYLIALKFPSGRVLQLNGGQYIFEDKEKDQEKAEIRWTNTTRVFCPRDSIKAILEPESEVEFQIWRDTNEEFAPLNIVDTILPLVSGKGSFKCSEFTNPGQSHFLEEIPVFRQEASDESLRAPDYSSPPEEPDPKKAKSTKKPSSRNSSKRKVTRRQFNAKDKKQAKALAAIFTQLITEDETVKTGFSGESKVTIDLQFTRALVLKPLVPHATKRPRDLFINKDNFPSHHLDEACKKTCESSKRLADEILSAQKMRQDCQLAIPDFPDDLIPLLNKSASYHVALEELQNSISYTFAEYALAHNVQSEEEMETLQAMLPMFMHDIIGRYLHDYFIQPRSPCDHRQFLINQSQEAELMGRGAAAAEFLEELLAMDLTDANSWYLYSCLMLKHSEVTRCEECVRRGLTCDPNHLQLSILFASLLARQQKYAEAIDFLNSAHFMDRVVGVVLSILSGLANLPSKPILEEGESALEFANELLEMEDIVFAEQLIAQKQMADGETAEVLYMFGRLQYTLRDFAKAASFLNRAIAIEKTPESLMLLGHVEFERHRYEEAEKWFSEGLGEMFDHDAALRLGFIYLEMGNWIAAEGILFQCSPQNASVLLGLGIAAMELKKFKQADELLNRATVVNFRHPLVWAHLALFSQKMGRDKEAYHAVAMAKKWGLEDQALIQKLKDAGLYDGQPSTAPQSPPPEEDDVEEEE